MTDPHTRRTPPTPFVYAPRLLVMVRVTMAALVSAYILSLPEATAAGHPLHAQLTTEVRVFLPLVYLLGHLIIYLLRRRSASPRLWVILGHVLDSVAALLAWLNDPREPGPTMLLVLLAAVGNGIQHGRAEFRRIVIITVVGGVAVILARGHVVGFHLETTGWLVVGACILLYTFLVVGRVEDFAAAEVAHSRDLSAANERYRQLVDHAPTGIYEIDLRSQRLISVNDVICDYTGYSREELLAMDPRLLLSEASRAALLERTAAGMADVEPLASVESEIVARDGRRIAALLNAQVTFDDDGSPATATVVCHDITERKRLHRELAEADRLAAIGMLAAGVAHEINNPLTYVLGNLQMVEEDLTEAGTDELAARVGEAIEGAERVRRIVQDLRCFAHPPDERPEAVDLGATLERAASLADNEIRFRARLVKSIGALPPVAANDGRLVQLFVNLLVNAAQAIPAGRVESNEIRLRARSEAGLAVVEIEDTGSGIAAEQLGHLFEPFFTTKAEGEGTGLGLSICHNIVSSYGGSIEVESASGIGTTMRVRLPLAGDELVAAEPPERTAATPAAEPHEPAAGTAAAPASGRPRVLVIDDEPAITTLAANLLARTCEVETAASGLEARQLLASDDGFDIIFCDLIMPRETGMDLFDWLDEHRPQLCRRVVFMTGGAFTPRAATFIELVGNRRIEKPFRRETMLAEIDALRRPGARSGEGEET